MVDVAGVRAVSASQRKPQAEVDSMFVERWSHRALSERAVSSVQIASLFEAARWAPSANNLQPWLFVYAHKAESLARARRLLNDNNLRWAHKAPLLVFVFARKLHPETGLPLRTSEFDTGAAWFSLSLQAHKLGLSTRAMGGIHHSRVYEALSVPSQLYESMVAIAIGYPEASSGLIEELRAREHPNGRKEISEFVHEDRYR